MQRVLTVWRPALSADSLQQLNGPSVRCLLVHALNHLVALRTGLPVTARQGEVAEVDLGIQVVAPSLGDAQAAVGHSHVVEVGAKALVAPGAHRVTAGLVQVRLRR